MLPSDQLASGDDHPAMIMETTSKNAAREPLALRSTLRLPSFEALGIANPRPITPRISDTMACLCRGSLAHKTAILPILSSAVGSQANSTRSHNLVPIASHVAATLTPPTDSHDVLWSSTESVYQHASAASHAESTAASESLVSREDSFLTPHHTPRDVNMEYDPSTNASWLDEVVQLMFTIHPSANTDGRVMKILSHALPCPSTDGHIFSKVMSAFYEHTSSSRTSWINVFHALPGRFSLRDLPRSPPATPGQPFQGEDYFTQKVFDTAVTIADYHEDLSSLPRSPRPVVPPGSVDMAIVERYIPPPSTMEFTNMFEPNAPSILVDRLVELSPTNGTLLFVYPTRTGAQTFAQRYLSPILDPLLRSLAMLHQLPMAFCDAIGRMPVLEHLLDHTEMRLRMLQLCEHLSRPSPLATCVPTPCYSLVHATTGTVHPQRHVWADQWWIKQEKDRLAQETSKWLQEARIRRAANGHADDRSVASAEILRQLLEGIEKRSYGTGETPKAGIQVNIFVIRRTQ